MALETIQIDDQTYQYAVGRPTTIDSTTRILTLTDPNNTTGDAEALIASWGAFAEVHGLLLAAKNRLPSSIQFVSVRNGDHNANNLRPYAQEELLRPFIVPVSCGEILIIAI